MTAQPRRKPRRVVLHYRSEMDDNPYCGQDGRVTATHDSYGVTCKHCRSLLGLPDPPKAKRGKRQR